VNAWVGSEGASNQAASWRLPLLMTGLGIFSPHMIFRDTFYSIHSHASLFPQPPHTFPTLESFPNRLLSHNLLPSGFVFESIPTHAKWNHPAPRLVPIFHQSCSFSFSWTSTGWHVATHPSGLAALLSFDDVAVTTSRLFRPRPRPYEGNFPSGVIYSQGLRGSALFVSFLRAFRYHNKRCFA